MTTSLINPARINGALPLQDGAPVTVGFNSQNIVAGGTINANTNDPNIDLNKSERADSSPINTDGNATPIGTGGATTINTRGSAIPIDTES